MKKLFISIVMVLFVANTFAASTLNIINATINYTLYFNTIAKMNICYPEIREYNHSGISGYCTLSAGGSISFNNYGGLSAYYPNITVTQQNDINLLLNQTTIPLVARYFTYMNIDWAYIIYKATHSTTGHVEGVWLGFSDFYSCHNLPSSWGNYGTTQTESFTTFAIGGDRYFVVGEY